MTLSSDINTTSTALKNIKDAINNKGGSASGSITTYPNAITNIPIPIEIGINREISAQGVYGMPTTSFTFTLPSNITSFGDYSLSYAFYGCTGLVAVNLSNLYTISGNYVFSENMTNDSYSSGCFGYCPNLTTVNLSNLHTISGNYVFGGEAGGAFQGCTSLTSVDLSSLTTVSGSHALFRAFRDCTSLTSVDLSSLTTVSGIYALSFVFSNCTSLTSVDLSSLTTVSGSFALLSAFRGCTGLTSVDLSSLTTISDGYALQRAFQGCTGLNNKSISFPALTSTAFGSNTNQFNNMLSGVSGCTVHFPSNLQSVIGSWSSVTSGFSGTNTTVLFDLPATT